ncbi:MAG: hypothetical protein ACYC27_16835 [Armatimonadota bacterium]
MLIIKKLVLIFIITITLAGCAKSPSGITPGTIKEMTVRITFNGPVNETYYYYFPIDTTGGGPGPVPVFPGITTGEGWVTGSANYYIQYHQRQYTLYRITSLQPFQSELIGTPIRSTTPSIGGRTLSFTIDLNAIITAGQTVDVNIISVDQPLLENRLLDGLGLRGTSFINVDITNDRTINNTDLNIEPANDVLDRNGSVQPVNDQTKPLDISDWSITTDV